MMGNRRSHEIFEKSYCYEGLPVRSKNQIILKLLRLPGLEPHYSWTIFQADQVYYLRRIIWDDRSSILPSTFASEIILPGDKLKALFVELENIKITPFLQSNTLVIDGVQFCLEFGSAISPCRLQWNSEVPKGWHRIQKWFDTTVEYFEKYLFRYPPK